jgi:peptidoglycan-associated lipoprotein
MKQTVLAVALLATLTFAACGKTPPPAPPPPAPVAPATPPPAPPPSRETAPPPVVDEYARLKAMASDEIDRMGLLGEIHFDLDKADLREGDRAVLSKNADVLKKFDFLKVTIEGHCDERGTVEYNLALGERRAKAAYDYVVSLGVPVDRLKTVSYGKEIQVCNDANEACWQRNRRAKFTVTGKTSR